MADDHIRSALEAPLAQLGLVLDDLAVTPAGRRRVVRVVIDRDLRDLGADDTTSLVPPLTLDEVAEATRVVSAVLDGTDDAGGAGGEGADLMGDAAYTLEVSSPGIDRSLQGHRAFRRNVTRLVALMLESGVTMTARILEVREGVLGDPAIVVVEVAAGKNPAKQPPVRHELALDEVTSAKVQVEFGRPGAVVASAAGEGDDGEGDDGVGDDGEGDLDPGDDEADLDEPDDSDEDPPGDEPGHLDETHDITDDIKETDDGH